MIDSRTKDVIQRLKWELGVLSDAELAERLGADVSWLAPDLPETFHSSLRELVSARWLIKRRLAVDLAYVLSGVRDPEPCAHFTARLGNGAEVHATVASTRFVDGLCADDITAAFTEFAAKVAARLDAVVVSTFACGALERALLEEARFELISAPRGSMAGVIARKAVALRCSAGTLYRKLKASGFLAERRPRSDKSCRGGRGRT